ncbi:MAG: DUF2225 domain-containing protein [Spirochaetes bacterium]|nr:DUF2225 domain-containing protein [Spirochaetota bacterium]
MLDLNEKPKKRKISYRQKKFTKCPVCMNEFQREDMLTGGGRLIAGKLTDELRRLYEDNSKYSKIYPLAYMVSVCPKCLYAAYPIDFDNLTYEEINKIAETSEDRMNTLRKYFGSASFENDRDLLLGAASYLLAVECYSRRGKNSAPTMKKAISSIRAAWLFNDLAQETSNKIYKKFSNFFYSKAYIFYNKSLSILQTGEENLESCGHIGPDYEKNWGYDGILYMCAVLTVKFGINEKDINKRINNFEITKRYLSKLFGSGKASKTKPGDLMDMIRDLYDKINEMINEWYQQIGGTEE